MDPVADPPAPVDPAPQPQPQPEPGWRRAGRDVAVVAVLAVAVVLGLAAVTSLLPEDVQRSIHTPLVVGVLVIGTAWVMYRIARPGR